MKFLSKLERRFGRYAIRELPVIMIAFQVVGYTLSMFAPNSLNLICFDPILICRGQIWRLLTWVLMPPSELTIFTVIMLFFYYWIARTLANTWGDFYFNIYILGGILITDIGMMLAYPVLIASSDMSTQSHVSPSSSPIRSEQAKARMSVLLKLKSPFFTPVFSGKYPVWR